MKLLTASFVISSAVLLAAAGHSPIVAEDAAKDSDLAQAKLKYAQALVKLQEADLQKAQEANSQAPAAVPATIVQMLQSDVTMAKARVRALEDGAAKSQESPYVDAARDALANAEKNLKQAMDVNARVSGTFNALDSFIKSLTIGVPIPAPRHSGSIVISRISILSLLRSTYNRPIGRPSAKIMSCEATG